MQHTKQYSIIIALLFLFMCLLAGCDGNAGIASPGITEKSDWYHIFIVINAEQKSIDFNRLRQAYDVCRITNGLDGSKKEFPTGELGNLSNAIADIVLEAPKPTGKAGFHWLLEFGKGKMRCPAYSFAFSSPRPI